MLAKHSPTKCRWNISLEIGICCRPPVLLLFCFWVAFFTPQSSRQGLSPCAERTAACARGNPAEKTASPSGRAAGHVGTTLDRQVRPQVHPLLTVRGARVRHHIHGGLPALRVSPCQGPSGESHECERNDGGHREPRHGRGSEGTGAKRPGT